MTVSFRSYTSDFTSGGPSLARPTNTAVGDMLIAIIASDSGSAISPPDGTWTEIDQASFSTYMSTAAYFKVAVSDSGPYVFSTVTGNSSGHLLCITKDSGAWTDPDGANLHNTSQDTVATLVTGSVTPASGDCLIAGWINDGNSTVSTAPSGMTITNLGGSNFTGVVYYQDSMSAGAVTKSLEWSTTDQTQSQAIVVGAAAAGTAVSAKRLPYNRYIRNLITR